MARITWLNSSHFNTVSATANATTPGLLPNIGDIPAALTKPISSSTATIVGRV